ncbi:MAG: TIM barrel protein [Candidatus Sumerlaeota bacterium]|nr:TIM barrel protein [Candidatus Sumerlaeota bacterium]
MRNERFGNDSRTGDAAESGLTRRGLLQAAGGGALAAMAASGLAARAQDAPASKPVERKGNIKQCICQGCLKKMPFEQMAETCVRLGVKGIDLVRPDNWEVLRKYGLVGTMTPSHNLGKGLNQKENHEACLDAIRKSIEATAAAGFPNVICFSGNRAPGLTDEEGLANCVVALKQVVGLAEEKKIMLCMELLNSKVNHKGYMCDHSAWGVELCKQVGSPNFKLLYDIYHMQVQEGDIIRTLTDNIQYIGHIHTAGNPGRHEIDDTQELYYPAIMRALVKAGYTGYVAHEYTPTRDPLQSLEQALATCDV